MGGAEAVDEEDGGAMRAAAGDGEAALLAEEVDLIVAWLNTLPFAA
jgi:hypothetical protein